MKPTTQTFTSTRGSKIEVLEFTPDDPKATVLVIHGLGEYAERYSHISNTLVDELGMVAWNISLEGYGRSDGRRGYVPSFEGYYEDLSTLSKLLNDKHPNLPRFVAGHSMGGLISLELAYRHPETIEGGGVHVSGPCLAFHPSQHVRGQNVLLSVGNKLLPKVTAAKVDPVQTLRPANMYTEQDAEMLNLKVPLHTARVFDVQMKRFAAEWRAGKVGYPFFIVMGENDGTCDLQTAKDFCAAGTNENKGMDVIAERKHEVWQEDNWKETIQLGVDWLRKMLE